jgi:hypothetical protein
MTTQLRGTMLAPGVSANRRLYTAELIQKAYDKLSARIKEGTNPVTMLTHHAAEDNSTKIVGRITSVSLDDGKLNYTAELANTPEADTIAELVAPKGGKPQFLRGVSIRGWWCGEPTTKTVEGMQVSTADDMEIDGLDFTKNPGVTGAYAEMAETTATEARVPVGAVITESVETYQAFTEAVKTKPYGSVQYADPGYQKDKVKRYPIDTKAHAKAAWSYINQVDNQKLYTAAQLKRIRARIKAALNKFGVNVSNESTEMPEPLTESATTISECYACTDDTGRAGFSISAYNGPLTVSVSAYSGVEPADLEGVAMAAMQAACDAIHALDPDDDGDVDTGTSEQTPDDNQMESAPAESSTVKESDMGETTETPAPAEETTTETPAEESATTSTPAEETSTPESEDRPITLADLNSAVAAAVSAALNPPEAAETAETAAPQGEVTEAAPSAEELRESLLQEVIAEAVKNGTITRKGIVLNETQAEAAKPLHEMNEDEFRKHVQERSDYFFAHNQ